MEQINILVSKGLMNILEVENEEYQLVKNGFLKGMGFMGNVTNVMAIHKNNVASSLTRQARLDSFMIFSKAVATKCAGDPNVRYAWYGSSLDDLKQIVSLGFHNDHYHNQSHSVGISLFSAKYSIDSAMCTMEDENGLRHVMLCRVIVGKVEAVPDGSNQSHPSSIHYDTGVDDISAPTRHIIWPAFINSHIHPDYIVSFKYTYMKDPQLYRGRNPQSKYVLFPNLMARVSNHLKPLQMSYLLGSYRLYQVTTTFSHYYYQAFHVHRYSSPGFVVVIDTFNWWLPLGT
ncbi:probable inactive poly [ADP-ribose] polymerase SRO2 isoform X1 [Arachis ipaensis]|uniref:probable inactive poly [ADP-ribose] polymerase SRO2 isoform X1 n=1 Tax=Arachis ipaensis TaxID=130454 RepID=UPI000A2B8AB1|nr:probable inactive poly [ADP-ribose] polymerase SRO2 isoform X1 [Arachis ipaensis]